MVSTPQRKDEAPPLEPGTVLGDTYVVEGVLGRGGMGVVYEVSHRRVPQRFAVKVIGDSGREDALARFNREAEIASSLEHSHIAQVFDFNTLADGRPYMVMELLIGEDLAAVLKNGPLSIERTLRIARQVGSGLAAAHEKGIVHRDLKPPNIFLSMREVGGEILEHVTILDFGISKIQSSSTSFTSTDALVGTPQYMAPEQAMGERSKVGPASDQFALGCVLYEMLAGMRAFTGEQLAEIVYKLCHAEPKPLSSLVPGIPEGVASAIHRALAKKPEDRFESISEFIRALTGRPLEQLTERRARMELSKVALSTPKPRNTSSLATDPTLAQVTVRDRPQLAPGGIVGQTADRADRNPERSPSQGESESEATRHRDPGTEKVRPPKSSASPRKRSGLWVAAAVAVGVGSGAIIFALRSANSVTPIESDAGAASEAVAPSGSAFRDASPASPGPDAAPAVVPTGGGFDAAPPAPPDAASAPGGTRSEAANPETSRKASSVDLEAATQHLEAGRFSAARRAIQRSPAAKTQEGLRIVVLSYCGEGRLGPALDWLVRVTSAKRQAIVKQCRDRYNIDLSD